MKVMSNAFFVEISQSTRWDHGPLELAFVPDQERRPGDDWAKVQVAIHDWNSTQAAGFLRGYETMETLKDVVPALEARKNPNIIIVPETDNGVSQLDVMLASLLPDEVLSASGLERKAAMFHLTPFGLHDLPTSYRDAARAAFSAHIWKKLLPASRYSNNFFAPNSSLRLLAGDATFWMSRIYRVAAEHRELFDECDDASEKSWTPLPELASKILHNVSADDRKEFAIRRPLQGGRIWDETDSDEREGIIDDAIHGVGTMESVQPVIELLLSNKAQEDFSERNSWIKEDFERAFYSKRAKVKVELIETIDDCPVWSSDGNEGYENALFRDVLSFLDRKERKLVIALRMGRTVSEIAVSQGLNGHGSVSRRLKALKAKVERLLD